MKRWAIFGILLMTWITIWGVEAQASEQQDVVVVLDPGHDSKHCGAWYSGIKEESANLKIAKACKEELEKYDGVKVYLTRTGSSCPFPKSKDNKDDIKKRIKWADSVDGDVYVCLHLNASTKKSDNGAMVFYSKYSTDGKNLARKIQDNLVALGLKNNGIKKDYHYVAIKTPGQYGMFSVLVEHAFMSNKSDVTKYINTSEKLKKLGEADAKAIAEFYGLEKVGTVSDMKEAAYNISTYEENVESYTEVFEIIPAGEQFYYLVTEDRESAVTLSDGMISMEPWENGNKKQQWQFVGVDNGQYYIRADRNTYLSLAEKRFVVTDFEKEETCLWNMREAEDRSIEGLEPVLISAENIEMDVKVKWKKLTGAEGYYVLRKTEESDWECVQETTDTEWTDDTVYADTSYFYTIQAYKADTVSVYEKEGISIKTPEKKLYNRYKTKIKLKYRSGPGTKYSSKGTLSKSKYIYVEKGYSKTANGYRWYRFLSGTKSYYTKAKYLKKVSSKDFRIYKTICETEYVKVVNEGYEIAGNMKKGTIVRVVDGSQIIMNDVEWAWIYKDGSYYYVRMDCLR